MQVTFSALLKGAGVLKSAGTVSDKFNSLADNILKTMDKKPTMAIAYSRQVVRNGQPA